MAMMSASRGRRSARDSEADVETEIYVRPEGMPWDRVMVLQIMNDLETRLPRVVGPPRRHGSRVVNSRPAQRVTPVPPPDEPNVFLMPWTPADPPPPWAHAESVVPPPGDAAAVRHTLVLDGGPGRPRRVRTIRPTRVPWLFFVMVFGIAFGIGQDRQLRHELGAKVRVTTAHAAAVVAQRVATVF